MSQFDILQLGETLATTAFGAGLGVAAARSNQRRSDQAAARSALKSAFQQLAKALIAYTVTRDSHDKVRIGRAGQSSVLRMVALQCLAGALASDRPTIFGRFLAAAPATAATATGWRAKVDEAGIQTIASAFTRVTDAIVPLLVNADAAVADAADKLLKTVQRDGSDDTAMNEALIVLRDAVRSASAPPVPLRRRLVPQRHPRTIEAPREGAQP